MIHACYTHVVYRVEIMVVPLIWHKDNGKQELCNCSMSMRTLSQSNARWGVKEHAYVDTHMYVTRTRDQVAEWPRDGNEMANIPACTFARSAECLHNG